MCNTGIQSLKERYVRLWDRSLVLAFASACLLYLSAGASISNAAFPGRNGVIAFVRGSDSPDIYRINVDGSGLRRLASAGRNEHPNWSASGSMITFTSDRDGDYEIYKMRADGSSPDNLTDNIGVDWGSTWSPNGSQIAFYGFRVSITHPASVSGIYTMLSNGTMQRSVISDRFSIYGGLSWSSRSGRIVFHSNREGGNYEIYSMDVDGTGLRRLTFNDDHDWSPDWSPDGRRIVFESYRDDSNGEIYTMNADGSGVTRLTFNDVADRNPAWSPDGIKIAFDRWRSTGNHEIYTMNADGSGLSRLTFNTVYDSQPDWQPLR